MDIDSRAPREPEEAGSQHHASDHGAVEAVLWGYFAVLARCTIPQRLSHIQEPVNNDRNNRGNQASHCNPQES